jgi:hypothetical protein
MTDKAIEETIARCKYPPLRVIRPTEKGVLNISVGCSNVDFTKHRERLYRMVIDALDEYPDVAEGLIHFDGVAHFFTYNVMGDYVEVTVTPREVAEKIFQPLGLTTYELFD